MAAFSSRTLATGLKNLSRCEQAYELIMQIINQKGSVKFQMFTEYVAASDDDILFVQPKPSTLAADFVFNYQHFSSIPALRKNYDRLLKRITVISDTNVFDKEEQLDTDTFVVTGAAVLSWSGNAQGKRFTSVVNSGDAVVTLTTVANTSMTFNITGTTINVTITVWGNKWDSSEPTSQGEFINFNNMTNNRGNTSILTNPLVLTDAEAADVAEGLIDDFGTPDREAIGLTYPYLNFLLEQNDMTLVWAIAVFTDNLFFITGTRYHWDETAIPGDASTFDLEDSGLNFSDDGDFIYERDKPPVSGNVIAYDTGFLYDMVFGVGGVPSDVLASKYINNIGYTTV